MNKFRGLVLLVAPLAFLLSACEPEEVIPGRIEKPDVEEKFNDLGFAPHKDGEPYDSYEGLVMAGYQGWFGCPGDGCSHGNQFYHYQENGTFKPGVLQNSIDFWPDMSEYEKGYDTEFKYPDGTTATIYSAYDESSVLLHFKWMKDYGIDGVFMQRFVAEVVDNPRGKDHFDKVLQSAMKGSNEYQRAICVMYDLGGFMSNSKRNIDAVYNDACDIASKYNLFDRKAGQKYYLYQSGKPMIVLWGVGFSDGRPYSIADCTTLVKKLKQKGFSVMLGVPTYWRELRNDCLSDKSITELIKSVDVIMPWFVGRYDYNGFDNFKPLIKSDISWCQTNKVGYAPLCCVGYSDRNMHPNNAPVDRMGGKFYWKQAFHCIESGAKMLYIAMFDEIDEGTAIYKVCRKSEVPSNEPLSDYYVLYREGKYSKRSTPFEGDLLGNDWCRKASEMGITFQGIEDELQSDYYLWLVGQSRAMLRGEIPLKSTLPVRK